MVTSTRVVVWGSVFLLAVGVSWWYIRTIRPSADLGKTTTVPSPQPVLNNVTVDENGTIRLKQ